MSAERSDRELLMTREFDAPRELVFDVWTQPQHVAQWWGPRGFTNTVHEMSVTPGGVWRLTMHGPDGTDYPNRIVFREVVKPERLVYQHSGDSEDDKTIFNVVVTFEQLGAKKTKLTMRTTFATAAELQQVIDEHGALEGAIQHLDRLGEYLAKVEASHV